jgi:hypothetical protein
MKHTPTAGSARTRIDRALDALTGALVIGVAALVFWLVPAPAQAHTVDCSSSEGTERSRCERECLLASPVGQ